MPPDRPKQNSASSAEEKKDNNNNNDKQVNDIALLPPRFHIYEENLLVFSDSEISQVIKTLRLVPKLGYRGNFKQFEGQFELKLCNIHSRINDWNAFDVKVLSGPAEVLSYRVDSPNNFDRFLGLAVRVHFQDRPGGDSNRDAATSSNDNNNNNNLTGVCAFVNNIEDTMGIRSNDRLGQISIVKLGRIYRVDILAKKTDRVFSSESSGLHAYLKLSPPEERGDVDAIISGKEEGIKIVVSYSIGRIRADINYKMYVSRSTGKQDTSMTLRVDNTSLAVPIENTLVRFLANVKNSEMHRNVTPEKRELETTPFGYRSMKKSARAAASRSPIRGYVPMAVALRSSPSTDTGPGDDDDDIDGPLVNDESSTAQSSTTEANKREFSTSLVWPNRVNIPERSNFYTSSEIIAGGSCHFENIFEAWKQNRNYAKTFLVWDNTSGLSLPAGVCTVYKIGDDGIREIMHSFDRPPVSSQQKQVRNRVKDLKGITCMARSVGSETDKQGSRFEKYEFEFDNQTLNEEKIHIHMRFSSSKWENYKGIKFTPKTPSNEYEKIDPTVGVYVATIPRGKKSTLKTIIKTQ